MASIFLSVSAVRVHDSQAYRKMDVTRVYISGILELREMPLLLTTSSEREATGQYRGGIFESANTDTRAASEECVIVKLDGTVIVNPCHRIVANLRMAK